jgi:deoxyribose-phosphate aldolase
MNRRQILKTVDHTLLNPACFWAEIREVCEDAIRYGTASACIPPSFVRRAKEFVGDRMKLCTVIGFPNGYGTTAVKVFEARDAVSNGADELDMVINIGALKDGDEGYIADEISAVKEVCGGRILKVIIETCLLTDDEKIAMCRLVTDAGADYIKTSTGFSTGGATFEDIRLLKAHIGPDVKVKASGGIAGFEDAEEYIRLGCSRSGRAGSSG